MITESILPSPCSRSDLFFSLAKVRLLFTLTLSHHTIWCLKQTALFFFFLAKAVLAYLPTALCGSEATLSFSAGPVYSSFSTEACAILQALRWSRQHQQVCLFSFLLFLFDSRSVLATLSSAPSFLLPQTLWQISGINCLLFPPVLQGYNGSPDTCLFRGTTRLISWPDGERYSCPLQSLVVSLLLSLVSTLLFSWTGSALTHLNSSTHRFPRFPPRSLCFLVMLAVSSLVYAATDTAYRWALISLELAESRILPAASADTRPRTPLISFCTVQLRTLYAARSLATLCLSTTSGPDLGELPGFRGSMVFRHVIIPWKGSGNNNNNNRAICSAENVCIC